MKREFRFIDRIIVVIQDDSFKGRIEIFTTQPKIADSGYLFSVIKERFYAIGFGSENLNAVYASQAG